MRLPDAQNDHPDNGEQRAGEQAELDELEHALEALGEQKEGGDAELKDEGTGWDTRRRLLGEE